jgi:hypothetical protein
MIGRFLCRVGLHNWHPAGPGRGMTVGKSRMAIFYVQECRRCGKREDAVMTP